MNTATTLKGNLAETSTPKNARTFDWGLLVVTVGLVLFGLILVSSASMPIGDRKYASPYYFIERHAMAIAMAAVAGFIAYNISMPLLAKSGKALMLIGIALSAVVMIPGLGHTAGGATRWISLAGFHLQPSEFLKLIVIIYIAGFIVRNGEDAYAHIGGVIRSSILIGAAAALTLAAPDLGATMVIVATAVGMMFLAGMNYKLFIATIVIGLALAACLIFTSPYRIQRVVTMFDPWQDPFDKGYQSVQALIAFGRGGLTGVGLGNGIQKMFFLPDVHTDFILSVVGEEFGLMGMLLLIIAFLFVIWRAFQIGLVARRLDRIFPAYLAMGIAILFAIQVFISIGMNVGMLPTKGLPTPFLSYASNSLIVNIAAIGLLLHIDRDNCLLPNILGSRSGKKPK